MDHSVRGTLCAAAALVIASPAWADMQSCINSEARSGSWINNGVHIEFNDLIPGVTPDVAYDRIYRAASDKFDVTASDRQTHTISAGAQPKKGGGFLGQMMQTSDMSYRMTFNIDPAPGGSKVTLILKFRQGLMVGHGGTEDYCEVVEAAQGSKDTSR
jgi:hypothetical protein